MNQSYNITGNGTVIIPGNPHMYLEAIVINTKGGSSNQAILYDGNAVVSADPQRKKATIDTTASIGRLEYDMWMEYGIYIVLKTGTAADITVLYREAPGNVG